MIVLSRGHFGGVCIKMIVCLRGHFGGVCIKMIVWLRGHFDGVCIKMIVWLRGDFGGVCIKMIILCFGRSGNDSVLPPKDGFQLLSRATQVLREEYIQRQDHARQELDTRLDVIIYLITLEHVTGDPISIQVHLIITSSAV